jgi:CRISPR-associated endonuclease Csy4
VEQKAVQGTAGQEGFNTYGLSLGTAVPWF